MSVENALTWWEQLLQASPHGCRVHLTGGEPFGDWPRLAEICRRAASQGLGPLEKVETNGFWAVRDALIRERLKVLDEAGMEKLSISADPYHQQFVPIEHVRRLTVLAEEVLGPARVQVRWRDWLRDGFDTGRLEPARRQEVFKGYAPGGRDRWSGRGAGLGLPATKLKCASEFVDKACREALLRGKHVHVDPEGRVMPGTCGGIVLGRLGWQSVAQIWRALEADHASRPVVGSLVGAGPVGLARAFGCTDLCVGRFPGKCALCWEVRRRLSRRCPAQRELGPGWMYEEESTSFGNDGTG
jgi:hypothetical protein